MKASLDRSPVLIPKGKLGPLHDATAERMGLPKGACRVIPRGMVTAFRVAMQIGVAQPGCYHVTPDMGTKCYVVHGDLRVESLRWNSRARAWVFRKGAL